MERSERPRWDGDVRAAVRVYGGWFVALVGGLLCAIGWYGVSGEKYEARQIPYLASATIPGAALIVAGAVLIAARSRGSDAELRRRVAELHGLLVEAGPEETEPGARGGAPAESPDRGVGASAPDPTGRSASGAESGASGSAKAAAADAAAGTADRPAGEGGAASRAASAANGPGATASGETGSTADSAGGEPRWFTVPGGARYHRPGCTLVTGKPAAYPVTRAEAAEQGLRPCPLCDPGDLGPAAPAPGEPDGAPSTDPAPKPDSAPRRPTDAAPATPNEPGSTATPGAEARTTPAPASAAPSRPATPDTPKPGSHPANHPVGTARQPDSAPPHPANHPSGPTRTAASGCAGPARGRSPGRGTETGHSSRVGGLTRAGGPADLRTRGASAVPPTLRPCGQAPEFPPSPPPSSRRAQHTSPQRRRPTWLPRAPLQAALPVGTRARVLVAGPVFVRRARCRPFRFSRLSPLPALVSPAP